MASPTPAAAPDTESAASEAEAEALAGENQLEFRARHALTIDAQANNVLEPKYAREMRAVPLGIENGRPVVAVADPSEKRLESVRNLVGPETKFVLVAPESLDALLKSRIFSEAAEAAAAAESASPAIEQAPQPAEASEQPPGSEPQPEPELPPAADAESTSQPSAAAASQPLADVFDAANVRQLAEQLAAAAETLIALQTQVQGIAQQFEHTRQELREQKEQLALAAAKADQDRARIRSVAASMADDMARLEQTKADLAERLSGLVQDE
jgi:hypothetical protein